MLVDRLKTFIEYNNISIREFERINDFPNGTINSMKDNISANRRKTIVENFPTLNINWLITGIGSMIDENKTESPEVEAETEDLEESPTGYYYPDVSAAAGLDKSLLNEEIEKLPVYLPQFGRDVDFINVYGDSMYPRYNAGEIIGVKYIEYEYLNYGFPYVVVFKNGDVFIKYVRKGKDEDHILLASENPIYEPREFHLNLIKSFYSIRGVVKKEMM